MRPCSSVQTLPLLICQAPWATTATREAFEARACLCAEIRAFFSELNVLEVETPLLSQRTVTDPMLSGFRTDYALTEGRGSTPLYLQTSPEFAMKRLLASGMGSIFQISKAFRNGEVGRHHNPEFTLLEWYRIGFDLQGLQGEVATLIRRLAAIFGFSMSVEYVTYLEVFQKYLDLHPLDANLSDMSALAASRGLGDAETICGDDRGYWLDFLFSCLIQPKFKRNCLTMVSRYPAILPSLAKKSEDDARWVERVELFMGGIELGNGFHELTDPIEQEARFRMDLAARTRLGMTLPEIDDRLLDALKFGLPECSGIAIGLDRLLMVLTSVKSIEDVLAFSFERA